jgi:hypothetical protein
MPSAIADAQSAGARVAPACRIRPFMHPDANRSVEVSSMSDGSDVYGASNPIA